LPVCVRSSAVILFAVAFAMGLLLCLPVFFARRG
jgi:hypothetical protein